MISFDSLIKNRRSIRKYKPDIPPREWLEEMITCAAMAPSPSNSQPVRFFLISTQSIKDSLHNAMIRAYKKLIVEHQEREEKKQLKNHINTYFRFSEFMFNAPVLFAVGTTTNNPGFAKKLFAARLLAEDIRGTTDLDISTGLALKGFILKGELFGLGSCILTAPLVFIKNVELLLGLTNIKINCFVTVGFADETPPYVEKNKVTDMYQEI